ncbi:HEAT repeat domain-containing protein [Archangium violaceum]|uniref:HEAT repeat domain-containing protein n=1 Tax=Archangium violaceum TaxID=83451 RepID=UPI00194FBE62|nr:HEAT repeat domain-containing protein [Archangium violaceum]QRN95220.1 HEAT repeat domain-containing protein [Archangium violaceum]
MRRLTSNDTEEILDALRELKLDKGTPPSDEVVDAGLELMKSPDVELRYEAIWALCLHWGHMRTLPMLRAMLEGREKDLEVLLLAARSAGSMVERCGSPDEETFRVLARVALNESADAELRGVAYTSLRAAAGLLSAQEEARLPDDIRKLDVEWEWLRAMATGRSARP